VVDREPVVDVGLVTWNTRDMTIQTLRHLVDSDQGCKTRLLVRDNGSQDGTSRALADAFPQADIDIGENVGFAAGVNTLLHRSTAPWFFLLTSDAWPMPGAIGALVDSARRHPHAAAVAPRLEYPDGTLQHSTHPFPSVRTAAVAAFAADRISRDRGDELLLQGKWMHDRPRQVDWAIGAALLIRRAAFEDVGGLDERFFMYAEDLEWCWRARKRGWEVWFEPTAVVRHVMGASGEKRYGADRTRVHTRNALRFYRREHTLPSTIAWWSLGLAGAGAKYLAALARRDRGRAATWRTHTLAHLRAWRKSP
jgi:N-acetylglucosaminyl-diphospho-decaprenol L-rhamnosyltransferase